MDITVISSGQDNKELPRISMHITWISLYQGFTDITGITLCQQDYTDITRVSLCQDYTVITRISLCQDYKDIKEFLCVRIIRKSLPHHRDLFVSWKVAHLVKRCKNSSS